jgi:hypothetical protein
MKTASVALKAFLASISQGNGPGNFWVADLFTFTLISGGTLRFTSFDQDVTVGGNTFSSLGPFLNRTRIRSKIGLEVDDLDIEVVAAPTNQLTVPGSGSQPVLAAIRAGVFDSARVLIERLFIPAISPSIDVSLGTIVMFAGSVGTATVRRASATLQVKSHLELLDVQMPRNLYQPGCRHTLFDSGCTLLKSSFYVTGAVTAGSNFSTINTNLTQPGPVGSPVAAPTLSDISSSDANINETTYFVVVTYVSALGESVGSPYAYRTVPANRLLRVSSPPSFTGATGYNVYVGYSPGDYMLQNQTPISIGTQWTEGVDGLVQGIPPPTIALSGYFALGVILFTSGVLTGVSRLVSVYLAGGTLSVVPALPQAPGIGDSFTILPGCDKSVATCGQKFSNLINFGGTPYVPQPEAAA